MLKYDQEQSTASSKVTKQHKGENQASFQSIPSYEQKVVSSESLLLVGSRLATKWFCTPALVGSDQEWQPVSLANNLLCIIRQNVNKLFPKILTGLIQTEKRTGNS